MQGLLAKHMDAAPAEDLAGAAFQRGLTHDHPLVAPELERLGLPVKVGVPAEERALMEPYPPRRRRRPPLKRLVDNNRRARQGRRGGLSASPPDRTPLTGGT